jgi:hypothetical protein
MLGTLVLMVWDGEPNDPAHIGYASTVFTASSDLDGYPVILDQFG